MNTKQFYLLTALCWGYENTYSSQLSRSQADELDISFGDIDENDPQELSPAAQQMEREEAMIAAASRGDLQAVENYIAAGVNVDAKNLFGEDTALMNAVMKGHGRVVKALIEAHANLDLQDRLGQTALMKAATIGKKYLVNKLLEEKADPNIRDMIGYTALHYAAKEGHVDTVKEFYNHGFDLNVRAPSKQTPLLLAADYNRPEVVKFLLKVGANPYVRDDEGKTIFDIARDPRRAAIKAVIDQWEKLQKPEHRKALQDVAEKVMQARWKQQVPEDISEAVQEMLRPTRMPAPTAAPQEVID